MDQDKADTIERALRKAQAEAGPGGNVSIRAIVADLGPGYYWKAIREVGDRLGIRWRRGNSTAAIKEIVYVPGKLFNAVQRAATRLDMSVHDYVTEAVRQALESGLQQAAAGEDDQAEEVAGAAEQRRVRKARRNAARRKQARRHGRGQAGAAG